jgi:hypothetical protein
MLQARGMRGTDALRAVLRHGHTGTFADAVRQGNVMVNAIGVYNEWLSSQNSPS